MSQSDSRTAELEAEVLEAAARIAEQDAELKELTRRLERRDRVIPLEIRIRVRDQFGRERSYAHRWDAVEADRPGSGGSAGMTLTTAYTDGPGSVSAEATVRVGI